MLKENLVEFIERSIKSNWDIESLADYKGEAFRYSEVAEKIARLHIIFEKSGISKGDKISLLGKNSANWAVVYLATISYGAVTVPILPDFKPEDVHNLVNHSDSVALFVLESILEPLDKSKMPALKAILSLTDFSVIFDKEGRTKEAAEKLDMYFSEKYPEGFNAETFNLEHIENKELAVISYTSGTTGRSKGVMIPHNSLIANVRFAHNHMPLLPNDKIVSFLPLAHAYGCAFEFVFPFTLGCHITFLGKIPSPQVIIQAFQEIRPRLILAVPLIIEKIYKNQLLPVISQPKMKILMKIPGLNKIIFGKIRKKLTTVFGGNFVELVIGGAAFNKDAEIFFTKIKFPFTVGYGMTECGPLISYAGWKETKIGSAGKLVDTLEIKIDSPDPYNEIGEIMVRGDNLMYGYYKNEKATKEVLDDEGWLHTGDLGVIDKENFIFIKGRSKSLILGPSGQNIYPEEIEDKINNMLYVAESVVVDRNEKLVALIFPDKDKMEKDGIDEVKLKELLEGYRRELNEIVPAYMRVSEFRIHSEEFEKTPKRSIRRFKYQQGDR